MQPWPHSSATSFPFPWLEQAMYTFAALGMRPMIFLGQSAMQAPQEMHFSFSTCA